MATGYVLYNPLAGNGKSADDVKILSVILPDDLKFYDLTRITNYVAFFQGIEKDDYLVIAGGDGTLNRFVNNTVGMEIAQEVYYFPIGSGNDFARDIGKSAYANPFPITQYLKDLPNVEANGKRYCFLNGVGYGIDGYCCQVGDEIKKTSGKKVNYAAIAVKGLLTRFRARNAKVSVDGQEFFYENVWIAPVMLGKHYGGGMIPTPQQDRNDPEKKLSLMVFHGAGRLRTLCVFPTIFKGTHVNHKKMVTLHTGHEITVEFDQPTPLQIDGETVRNVSSYTAKSAACKVKEQKELCAIK